MSVSTLFVKLCPNKLDKIQIRWVNFQPHMFFLCQYLYKLPLYVDTSLIGLGTFPLKRLHFKRATILFPKMFFLGFQRLYVKLFSLSTYNSICNRNHLIFLNKNSNIEAIHSLFFVVLIEISLHNWRKSRRRAELPHREKEIYIQMYSYLGIGMFYGHI